MAQRKFAILPKIAIPYYWISTRGSPTLNLTETEYPVSPDGKGKVLLILNATTVYLRL
ncbi:hypothetical protein J6590_075758 [Homalodisca vitripennis]|nr:hypothetical protein J6590_075758 [Homalodisca vitripennis]